MSRIEGQILVDIINDHGFDQLVHFPTRERNTLDLIITSLPNQFVDIHSPDCLSDHDIVSGTLKIVIPPIKKPRRKVFRYQKGDYESMRAETLKFAKEKYFNGCSFGLRYVSWYKYLIVGLVFSHLGFWSGNLFLIAPFPDLCLLVPFLVTRVLWDLTVADNRQFRGF